MSVMRRRHANARLLEGQIEWTDRTDELARDTSQPAPPIVRALSSGAGRVQLLPLVADTSPSAVERIVMQ